MPTKKTPKAKPPAQSTLSLLADRAALRRTNAKLRETNEDLAAQVRELLAAKPLAESERADITRLRAEHTALNDTQIKIVIYLRNNLPDELTGGDIGDIVCRCLQRYKTLSAEESERKAKQ